MSRETLAERIWWETDVPVFLEKFILPVLATAVTAVVILNPMKFDIQSRFALAIGVIAFAYLASHQIHLRNEAIRLGPLPQGQTSGGVSVPNQAVPPSVTNTTSGPKSPITTGNGNNLDYRESTSEKKSTVPPKKENSP